MILFKNESEIKVKLVGVLSSVGGGGVVIIWCDSDGANYEVV